MDVPYGLEAIGLDAPVALGAGFDCRKMRCRARCDVCRRPFRGFAGSLRRLAALLDDAGWFDGGTFQACPACMGSLLLLGPATWLGGWSMCLISLLGHAKVNTYLPSGTVEDA